MSLKQAANHLAAHGRGPDTELVHMTKGEINGLQTLAKANGGSLTINPHTGLAEAGFLSNILPVVAGAAAMYFTGGTAAPLIAGMSNAATIGMGIGALQTARTGSIQKGLMAGMGAYGGAGLAGGLMGAGAASAATPSAAPAVADAGISASQAPAVTNAVSQGAVTGQALPGMANYSIAPTAAGNVASAAPGMESMAGRIAAAGANTGTVAGATPMWKYGLAAAAPALLQSGSQQPQTTVDSGKMPQRLQYNAGRPTDAQGQTVTPQPDVPTYDSGMGQNFGRQQNYFPDAGYQNITDEQAKQMRGYAAGGILPSQGGGPVEAMSNANAVGANTGFPMADVGGHAYATPWQTPVSQNVVQGTADTGVNSMTGEQNEFAKGGLSAAASHLGDYSDGGRLLKGPGDGVSDSIPATIGNKRPARLADGEFVVPARIVSELGNGSTEAGARKLYAMLDRVQAARKKSIGKGKVAKNSRADKLLPA